VGEDLRVPGLANVFAIGDTAASKAWKGETVLGLAPAAKQGGTYVAKKIRAMVESRRPVPAFRYRHLGSLATIGRKAAVADFGILKLLGAPAWWLWGIVHIAFMLGVRNRVATLTTRRISPRKTCAPPKCRSMPSSALKVVLRGSSAIAATLSYLSDSVNYDPAEILAAQEHFGFARPTAIEKDWHILRRFIAWLGRRQGRLSPRIGCTLRGRTQRFSTAMISPSCSQPASRAPATSGALEDSILAAMVEHIAAKLAPSHAIERACCSIESTAR
jgi:hypothetical protein